MQIADYEKKIEELQKKQEALKAKEKQLKAKMSNQKRAKENHAKMVLGGAVLGVFGEEVPTDRTALRMYGSVLKTVLEKDKNRLLQMINDEFVGLAAAREKNINEMKGNYYANQTHNQF